MRRRKRKKSSLWKNRLFWFALLGPGIFLSAFYLLLFSSFAQIKNVQVQGIEENLAKSLRSFTQGFVGRSFAFFHTKSIVFVDVKKIQEEILRNFPEIETLQIKKSLLDSLIVIAQEKKEVATWCQKSRDECFSLDKEGVIFVKAQAKEGLPLFVSFQEGSLELGQKVIDEIMLSNILYFRERAGQFDTLKQGGVKISALEFISSGRADATTSENWKIYLNPKENVDWQLTKLQAVLEKKIPREKRKYLEYIELRFGDQTYIKYQK